MIYEIFRTEYMCDRYESDKVHHCHNLYDMPFNGTQIFTLNSAANYYDYFIFAIYNLITKLMD